MTPAARVVLGEVLGPHGIHGALRIRLQGEDERHLRGADRIFLGAGSDDSHAVEYTVRGVRAGRAGEAIVELAEITRREGAEALGGLIVAAAAELLEPLPEGEFYWYQLIGCRVFDETGEELGRLRGLLETGAHDVFVVEGVDKAEQLYPAAEPLLREIDIAEGRIVIAVPESAGVAGASGPGFSSERGEKD